MTEPPEPRRPEEGGGEEDWDGMERDAVRDFVADSTPDMQDAINAARAEYGDEAFDEMVAEVIRRANDPMRYTADLEELAEDEASEELDDDMLLDALGSGEDPDEGALTDMLGAWRDDVESVPPPSGTAPEVVQEIHDFTQEIDRATAPPRTTGRNEPVMSAQEDAERLRSIASSNDFPTPLIRAAHDAVDGILAQVLEIIGDSSQHRETVAGHAALAKDKAGEAIAAMIQFESAIHNAADGHARG